MNRILGLAMILSLFGCEVEHRRQPANNDNRQPEPEPEPQPEWMGSYSKTLKYGPRIPEMHAAALQAMKANGWRIDDEGRIKDDFSDIEAFKDGGDTVLKWHAGRHDHRTVTTLQIASHRLTNSECRHQFDRIHEQIAGVVGQRGDD